MRAFLHVMTVAAITLSWGCDRQVSPVAATPVPLTAPAPTPAADAVLTISSFAVTFNPQGYGRLRADFTLTEVGGRSGATLESFLFEESGGRSDFVDAWCLGDDPIRIPPLATFDARTLGYCQPGLLTGSPGDSASITIVYRNDDGRRATLRASTVVLR